MTMIERIARALVVRDYGEAHTDRYYDQYKEWYEGHAQVALEAMLEPSEGMISALFDDDKFATQDYGSRYRNAIKAAIAER